MLIAAKSDADGCDRLAACAFAAGTSGDSMRILSVVRAHDHPRLSASLAGQPA